MKELTQEQIVRLYNMVEFSKTEDIERAYLGKNTIETTIRDTKDNGIRSFTINFKNDLETLDFILNGIKLERD